MKEAVEEQFAYFQREGGTKGFALDRSYTEERYSEIMQKPAESLSVLEICYKIFPLIFGFFGVTIDLDKALAETKELAASIEKRKPHEPPANENNEYMIWLSEYAMPQILLGTIYSYKADYIKAAYHFMLGIKTEQIDLNNVYLYFISGIMEKLPQLATETATYEGCGFSKNQPMGFCGGNILMPDYEKFLISEMEGDNGEIIMAQIVGTKVIGCLRRLGSTVGQDTTNMIDIYETYIVDKQYKLQRVVFYSNGYCNRMNNTVKIATGFHKKANSHRSDNPRFITGYTIHL